MRLSKLTDWRRLCVKSSASILEAAEAINHHGKRAVFVVDDDSRLLGLISDSEIRRGLIRGVLMEQACSSIMNKSPFVAEMSAAYPEVLRLMIQKDVTLIPLVDDIGVLCGAWTNLPDTKALSNPVVVMAGGKGSRLLSLTAETPKPLVEIRGQKILARLLSKLAAEGFENVIITVHHMADQIVDFVGDGSDWGLRVNYVSEDNPLGTAGSLGVWEPQPTEPFLVTNSDVISSVDFSQLLDFHLQRGAEMTVVMREHGIVHPFGVIELQEEAISGIREKPMWSEFVSAGIYVLSPPVLELVAKSESLDMPDLVNRVAGCGRKVIGYPLYEHWRDIGTPGDYEAAQSE